MSLSAGSATAVSHVFVTNQHSHLILLASLINLRLRYLPPMFSTDESTSGPISTCQGGQLWAGPPRGLRHLVRAPGRSMHAREGAHFASPVDSPNHWKLRCQRPPLLVRARVSDNPRLVRHNT